MKKLIEELVIQLLMDQVMKAIYHLAAWLFAFPWELLCA
jgi:hypothetical protein